MPVSRPRAPMLPGLGRYRAVLATPGVRAPLAASALGSLSIGMYVLSILLLAHDAAGSLAEAGRVAAAFGVANAFGSVAQGRLVDRFGQVADAARAGNSGRQARPSPPAPQR
jgi:MFS family permease